MAALLLPRRSLVQPQGVVEADFGSELAQAIGLQIVWVGSNPFGAHFRNSGFVPLAAAVGSDVITNAGRAKYLGGTSGHYLDLGAFSAPDAVTCGIVGIASGVNAAALGNKSATAANGFDFVHGSGGTAGAGLFRIASTSVSFAYSSTKPAHLTGLWDRNSGGGVISAVVDGAITNGSSTTSISGSTQNLYVGRRATTYHEAGSLCLIYIGNKRAPEPVWRELHRNPWQILREVSRRRVFIGAASGAVTIDCSPGSATAAGASATVESPISVTCSVGNAAAAGVAATIETASNVSIACSVGDAAAAGAQAIIESPIVVDCAVGNADAAGVSAGIASSISIACSVGNASAAGVPATIDTPGVVTVSCSVGIASAVGVPATIESPISLSCSVGNATAAGVGSSISTSVVVNCDPGNAICVGVVASVLAPSSITCAVGNAVAAGVHATISDGTAVDTDQSPALYGRTRHGIFEAVPRVTSPLSSRAVVTSAAIARPRVIRQ